jgi:23S rRNA (uracil1939-C5)-methyltransferase
MKKNDLIEVTIEDLGVNGEGIGKVGTFPVFVKDAVIGDKVLAGLTKVKKNYAFARTAEILEPSPYRVTPACPVSRACGGCQIQPLSYEKQVEWKNNKVKGHLQRLGGFEKGLVEQIMEEPIASPKPFRYRNKMAVPFGKDKNGKIVAGFYAGRTHQIIPVRDCMLGQEVNGQILDIIIAHMEAYKIQPYDETKGTGLLRHALIRIGEKSGQIMVCLIINGEQMPFAEELVEKLTKIQGMSSIMININQENTNVILGKKTAVLWGSDRIKDTLCDIEFSISPLSFYQVNPLQAEKLYEKAIDYANLHGEEIVWDLYCGIGTISLCLAKKTKKVFGVEIVERAIEDARKNAAENGIENAEFYVGAAEDVFTDIMNSRGEEVRPDVVVVDPPRKGCDQKLLTTMLQMAPKRIVYVSCDTATMARDLKILCADGAYQLVKGCAVDQFSQTVHVEGVVVLEKRRMV